MKMTKMAIKKWRYLCSKAKNIRLKQQATALASSCGLDNNGQMVNGLALTPTSLPLKERNILTKFISEHNTIMIPTMWIIHPYNGTYFNTMIKTICPRGTIIGSSKENVLIFVPRSTSLTLPERNLISLALLFLVLMACIIIIS